MPTPDGNSDPKRKLTPKEQGVVSAVMISTAIMILTSPDPAKDPYDAHLEKANKKTKEPQKDVQDSYLEKKKVYEIEKLECH